MRDPGLVYDLDEAEYHDDRETLSSSMVKQVLRSPAHLRHYLDAPRERNSAFDFGTAFHTWVLGAGAEPVLVHANSWRGKDAQAERAAIEADGRVALLAHEFTALEDMASAVRAHPVASAMLSDGHPEVSAYGQHESGVTLRGRFDWLRNDGAIVDLKSCQNADPAEFHRTAASLGYHVQAAHYMKVHELATGKRPRGFVHVLVEKTPPYHVSVCQLDPVFLDIGHAQVEKAVAAFKHATDTDTWPSYPQTIHQVEPPAWLIWQQEDQEEEISI